MLPRRQGRARAGFTLVELLMVITIIGMLVGLGSYAAFQAIATGQNASIALDIQSLNAAMQSYKADHKQYPPDLSDINYSYRQTRFQNHIGLAFPRCGTSYATLKSYILNNTYKSYGYNYIASGGSATPLNLDTMDQAEALVFWLGGFPTPYTQTGTPMPLASRKLFGFHTDVTNPFRLDSGTGTNIAYRTTSLMDFDETRLVDQDQDGWYEYVPRGSVQGTNGKTPPYVYFDAGSYTQVWTGKTPPFCAYPMPRPSDPNGQMQTLMQAWGNAVPYCQWYYASASPPMAQWINPTTFQIISAGGDGTYGNPTSSNVRIPSFPYGATWTVPQLTQSYWDQAELDNITNFTKGTIDQDSSAQQGTQPANAGSSGSSGSGSGS